MKNSKIAIVTLLLAVILALLCPITAFATDAAYTEAEIMDLCAGDYVYEYLATMRNGEALQAFYRDMDAKAKAFHNDLAPILIEDEYAFMANYSDLGLTYQDAKTVWQFYRDDHPLYYWISNSIAYTSADIAIVVDDEFKDASVRKAKNENIYALINDFLADTKDLASPYLFALACHDMIIDRIDYAYKGNSQIPEDSAWAHSIIGVFEARGGVCESYARTFQLFLNARGIENALVTGYAGGPHAWNLAKMDDGNWYWFDLTWDDKPEFTDGIDYRYFCVNDTQNIKWMDGPWTLSATAENYFLEQHKPYTPDGTGEAFQYALPARAQNAFSADVARIRTEFSVGDFEFVISGDRKVYVTEIDGEGIVTIPETVEYRGVEYAVVGAANEDDGLFTGAESILDDDVTGLNIPKTLTFIWDFVFNTENEEFEGYFVDPENPEFCSENGILYTKDESVLIGFPSKCSIKKYALPAETRYIAAGAIGAHDLDEFAIHKDLALVGIKHMGYGYGNKTFMVESPYNKVEGEFAKIAGGAKNYKFFITIDPKNSNFKIVENGIYSAGGDIFYGVASPAIPGHFEIAEGTKVIEYNALSGFESLVSLTIPSSFEQIKYNSIGYCPKLIDILNRSSVDTPWAQNVYTPASGAPQTILEDGFAYFYNKLYVMGYYGDSADVVFPSGVQKIDMNVFAGRNDIESIYIPRDTKLEGDIFADCTSLKTLTVEMTCKEWKALAAESKCDKSFENVTVKCSDGEVVYSNGTTETTVLGDFDGNGELTKKDTTDLLSAILSNTAPLSCDISGDGKVTVVDVILLMKLLAGQKVTLN